MALKRPNYKMHINNDTSLIAAIPLPTYNWGVIAQQALAPAGGYRLLEPKRPPADITSIEKRSVG